MRSASCASSGWCRDDSRVGEHGRLAPGGRERPLVGHIGPDRVVAQLQQCRPRQLRGRLQFIVGIRRRRGKSKPDDPGVPAALAAVVARHLLDEPVLRELPEVVAARRGALADHSAAFGCRGVALELQMAEEPHARGARQGAKRLRRAESGVRFCEGHFSKIPFHILVVKWHCYKTSDDKPSRDERGARSGTCAGSGGAVHLRRRRRSSGRARRRLGSSSSTGASPSSAGRATAKRRSTQIEQFRPAVALVDIRMPKLGGIEVLRRAQSQRPGDGLAALHRLQRPCAAHRGARRRRAGIRPEGGPARRPAPCRHDGRGRAARTSIRCSPERWPCRSSGTRRRS